MEELAHKIVRIARVAAKEIMLYYNVEIDVLIKDDGSPVTQADKEADIIITSELKKLTPEIPVISEESFNQKDWKESPSKFWLVDPVDGTKEFIKRTGEFTVNIGLIENGQPVLGVIVTPVDGHTWVGIVPNKIAYTVYQNNTNSICVAKEPTHIIAASKSHRNKELEDYLQNNHSGSSSISAGSSLKFCLVAEGKVDSYPRLGTTMEWDTAAGHAIVLAAGGKMSRYNDDEPFVYGKANSGFKNPWFIASR